MRTLIAAAALAALASPASATDLLVTNVHGIDVDRSGKIRHFSGLLIGGDGKVKRQLHGEMLKLADTDVVDGGGRTVMPGLIDAHGHIMGLGDVVLTLDLTGTTSIADLQARLKAYAAAHPDRPWIIGRGWNQESWNDKRFPTAADIDAVEIGRPVWLTRVDGHAAVANSAAMKRAQIGRSTKAPVGGEIIDGLFVDIAQGLVESHIPEPTPAMLDQMLSEAQKAMVSVGLVSAADMGTSAPAWQAMRRAGEAGTLKVRIFSYAGAPENWRAINHGKPTDWLYGQRLKLVGTKIYTDGALGSRGAWLKLPYHDRPDTRGLQFLKDDELLAQVREVSSGGGQLAAHAIGDAANAQIITAYEKIAAEFGPGRRPRIEHFQIVDPKDIPRLKPAGIIASMQPTHQTSDRLMAEARLGMERLPGAYAWQTVEKLGIPIAFGSDFPVESPNPFPGLMAAVSREDMKGDPKGGWIPSERVNLAQAIEGFTRGAAYAGFAEGQLGCLDAGCAADFIVVDRDPTKVDPQSLGATKVLETWIGGEKIYAAPLSPAAAPLPTLEPGPERGR
ncbi:MAG: amidohydrolase family protein [Sphingomicrobium sp.]